MTRLIPTLTLAAFLGIPCAQAAATLKAPTVAQSEPSLYLLLRLPGDRADIRYVPGYLDRAANLQSRLEPAARAFENWIDRPFQMVAYVLTREEWQQAGLPTAYGIPVRVGRTGIAAPALGDDETVRLWADLLQGMLPTVQGLPLRGTPQHAASLVAADVATQLLMAETMVDDIRLSGDLPWVRGLLSQVIAVGLVKRFEENRLRELDAFYDLLTRQHGEKAFSARDYGPDLSLPDWLWFQAQFYEGAKLLIDKEGEDAIKKMIKLNKKHGTVPGAMVLQRYKRLGEWFHSSFSAVSMRRDAN